MYVVPFVLFLIMRRRAYYLAPAYPMLIAGGVVIWEHWLASLQAQRAVSSGGSRGEPWRSAV
jgi:hypothetical protein